MTLQEFYDKAVELGADPTTTEVVVEYCHVTEMRFNKEHNAIFID